MPWADALYACDHYWWESAEGCTWFRGLKYSQDEHVCARSDWGVKRIHLVREDRLVSAPVGTVGWGGNSGFQALNLAWQFGAARIVMVGFDMRIDCGLHWHGPHPDGMNNPSLRRCERWRRALDNVAPTLEAAGVEVFNTSPISTLTAYPRCTLEEALA